MQLVTIFSAIALLSQIIFANAENIEGAQKKQRRTHHHLHTKAVLPLGPLMNKVVGNNAVLQTTPSTMTISTVSGLSLNLSSAVASSTSSPLTISGSPLATSSLPISSSSKLTSSSTAISSSSTSQLVQTSTAIGSVALSSSCPVATNTVSTVTARSTSMIYVLVSSTTSSKLSISSSGSVIVEPSFSPTTLLTSSSKTEKEKKPKTITTLSPRVSSSLSSGTLASSASAISTGSFLTSVSSTLTSIYSHTTNSFSSSASAAARVSGASASLSSTPLILTQTSSAWTFTTVLTPLTVNKGTGLHPPTAVSPTTTITTAAPTSKPNPAAILCGLHGEADGNYFLAEFDFAGSNDPVTLGSCYELCAGVFGFDMGCLSYEFFPQPETGAPRCILFGGNVANTLQGVNNYMSNVFYDLGCGYPS